MSAVSYVEGILSASSKFLWKMLTDADKKVVAEALVVEGAAKKILVAELVPWGARNWYWVAGGTFVLGAIIGHV
jgi:hypothetical protein